MPDRARQTTSWEPPSRRAAEPPNRRTAELSSRLRYTVESRAWPSGPVIPDCRPIAISRHADRLAKDGPD
ncbi:hypothetical protein EGY16_17970 [Burkholderia pseudomallei]|nr:hypothetical protein BOC51_09780 [Burkholderia pseudomallei]AYX29743.1 hypothetical protein EGY16_17970 [Burkholderia pseudomallei]